MTVSPADTSSSIFPPWKFDQWRAVDDRVRGGASQSHLEGIELDTNDYDLSEIGLNDFETGEKASGDGKIIGARFWGHLGGAGFASQTHLFAPLPLHLPPLKYKGIKISVLPDPHLSSSSSTSSPTQFTLVLKTTIRTKPPKEPTTPPSPEPAVLTYEAHFSPYHLDHSLNTTDQEIQGTENSSKKARARLSEIPFDDFIPTYRGRPVLPSDPKYIPLHSEKIYELSLMCRSEFGKQQGDFGVVILEIEGWEKDKEEDNLRRITDGQDNDNTREMKDEKETWWNWLSSWWDWMRDWWRGEGKIKLDEEKV